MIEGVAMPLSWSELPLQQSGWWTLQTRCKPSVGGNGSTELIDKASKLQLSELPHA